MLVITIQITGEVGNLEGFKSFSTSESFFLYPLFQLKCEPYWAVLPNRLQRLASTQMERTLQLCDTPLLITFVRYIGGWMGYGVEYRSLAVAECIQALRIDLIIHKNSG